MEYDSIWLNAKIACCNNGYDLIEEAALAVKADEIAWISSVHDLPGPPESLAKSIHDVRNHCITPGLIDCHTHVIYAGNRAHEFELRLKGATYQAIAQQGGGINATVRATRAASEEELLDQSLKRVQNLIANGTTTIEIKSGYGLDLATEVKMLRVAKQIGTLLPITIYPTFLGAHTVPSEYVGRADQYIDLVCNEMIPIIAEEKLAHAVDVFCEKIAFNLSQTERVFKTAQQYGLKIKCHAEQLSAMGAAQLASAYHALSVDHLEFLSPNAVPDLVPKSTTAVLLPGAYYFLREKQLPPIDALRQHRVPMAVATDCNPGTSPVVSQLLAMNLACTQFRLTPEEVLLGSTHVAAKALGCEALRGSISVGKKADFAVWRINQPAELAYYLGLNPLSQLIKNGKFIDQINLINV
mgnify:CR=1 FL=1